MKSLKLLFTIIITGTLLSSCTTIYEDSFEDNFQNQISLEQVMGQRQFVGANNLKLI